MKATLNDGSLVPIPRCQIDVAGRIITLTVLPDITDSKAAAYVDEQVIGRSFPIKKFSHGENRTIGMKVHFLILQAADAQNNLSSVRALQSAVYPRTGLGPGRIVVSGVGAAVTANPYVPPPICRIRCGNLFT